METLPRKFGKSLVTPEPHYIPGYAGHCPQLKYHLGKTYGQLTAKLLTSREVSHSRRPGRHSSHFPSIQMNSVDTEMGRSGQKDRMIPGYTGFVPNRQNYFSKTYVETCREALGEFELDKKRRMQLHSADVQPELSSSLPDFKPRRLTTPLTAISKQPAPYKPVDPYKPCGSPYFMDDSSPYKYFISGFTGYVPKARFLIGTGYPIITNKALIQFSKEMKGGYSVLSIPDKGNSLPSTPIYPPHYGMLPSYTGHVPGYKFQYGQTFGQLTTNALSLSGVHQQVTTK